MSQNNMLSLKLFHMYDRIIGKFAQIVKIIPGRSNQRVLIAKLRVNALIEYSSTHRNIWPICEALIFGVDVLHGFALQGN